MSDTSKAGRKLTGEQISERLLQSIAEMNAGKAARATRVALNEVAAARMKTGLSQSEFARALRISPRTLQEWEQGRRKPSGSARTLIEIALRHPEVIAESLNEAG